MNRHSVPNATFGLPGKPADGGSRPRFYEFDDNVTRLVKWFPSPHGTKPCFNELVVANSCEARLRSLRLTQRIITGFVQALDFGAVEALYFRDDEPPGELNHATKAGQNFGFPYYAREGRAGP